MWLGPKLDLAFEESFITHQQAWLHDVPGLPSGFEGGSAYLDLEDLEERIAL